MTAAGEKNAFSNDFRETEVDPRIIYPCYKSMDSFLDIDRLRNLDGYIEQRIRNRIQTDEGDYFLNLYRLDRESPYKPGVREVWLTRLKAGLPAEYVDRVDETDIWERTEDADEFSELMDFLSTLPFKKTGRILVIYDDGGREVPAHRDHLDTEVCNEFIWLRTNMRKPFYMLDNATGTKKYVESYSAWFDAVNQYHGCDGTEGLTFSIRVDGIFTDSFRETIPKPKINPASTPALWAVYE